jgi:hypothetical protein
VAGLSAFVLAGLETRAAFGAWRRFAVVVVRFPDGPLPAFIACPKLQDKPSYRLKLAKGKGIRRLPGPKQESRLVFCRIRCSRFGRSPSAMPAVYRLRVAGPSRMPLLFQN